MAELTQTRRDRLKDSQFAYIDGDGERHLPIHDDAHVRNAIARFSQTHFDTAADERAAARRIRAAARRRGIDVDASSDVAKAAKRRS